MFFTTLICIIFAIVSIILFVITILFVEGIVDKIALGMMFFILAIFWLYQLNVSTMNDKREKLNSSDCEINVE